MKKKRSSWEIIRDILLVIQRRGPHVKPTHILSKSNLSHQMLTLYLGDLQHRGLLVEEQQDEGKRTYSLTEKGFLYLRDAEKVSAFMESYGIEEK
ncbi:hypothetical protein HZB02_04535 [Candidatus Woesearchaeota archaeon]|nr:hypothetical protein [Candidatus Woesearchaeota archaeon]